MCENENFNFQGATVMLQKLTTVYWGYSPSI